MLLLNKKNTMINRRKVIKNLASLPFIGAFLGSNTLSANPETAAVISNVRRDFFKELGLRTFINAAGNLYIYDWITNVKGSY